MRQISGGDAFFLFADKESKHQHLSVLYIYDQSTVKGGKLRFKTILEFVEDRLGASPLFRQRLVDVPLNLDYPYWINDPEFNLEYHVRHIALPQPGDWRQLCIQASRLHSRPLDMTRPLWEMYVIEGLNNVDFLPEGSFAIMLKVHHVAIDGISAAEMTMGMHDLEAYPARQRRKVRWRPEKEPRPVQLLSRALRNNIRASLTSGSTIARKLTDSFTHSGSPKVEDLRDHTPAPTTRFSNKISPNRVWDAVRFDLATLKQIKNSVPGTTLNDVVMTICGGAVSRYLDSKNETPNASLTAMVPVSVRNPEEMGAGGNKVHLARASLMTGEADAKARLQRVSEEMKHVKGMAAVGAREMVEMQEQLPAPTMLMATKAIAAAIGPGKSYRAQHNMIITNVPGPQQPLYFCGARLAMFTGLAVISDNLGLSHAVTSYDGTLVIAPVSDREHMPDPAFYANCLQESYEDLLQSCGAAQKKAPARKRVAKKKKAPVRKKAPQRKKKS